MRAFKIELPFPPSVNGYWRSIPSGKSTRQITSKRGREYREAVALRVAIARANGAFPKEPLTGRLRYSIELFPPSRHRRDISNFAYKAIQDALTHAGAWVDDSQIDEEHAYRRDVTPPGYVLLEVEEI
jgi:crossover junction endodeoxyribonuclease RusA